MRQGTLSSRKLVLWCLGLTVLPAVGLIGFLLLAGNDFYQWAAAELLERVTDRKVEIKGPFSFEGGWTPTIVATDLSLANASWAKQKPILRVRRIELQIALKPLFSGIVQLPRLVATDVTLNLERGPDGAGNWEGIGLPARAPVSGNAYYPLLEFISLRNVGIKYQGEQNGRVLDIFLAHLDKDRPTTDSSFVIEGQGRINQRAFRIAGQFGSVADALTTTAPYPMALTFDGAGLAIELKGTAQNLPRAQGFDLNLSARANSVGEILKPWESDFALAGRAEVSARLTGDLVSLSVQDFSLDVIEPSGDRLQVQGSITELFAGSGLNMRVNGKLGSEALHLAHMLPEPVQFLSSGFTRLDILGQINGSLKTPAFENVHAQLTHDSGASLSLQGRLAMDLTAADPKITGLAATAITSLPDPGLLARALGTDLAGLGPVNATAELSLQNGWGTLDAFTAEAQGLGALRFTANGRIGQLNGRRFDLTPQLELSASAATSGPLISLLPQSSEHTRTSAPIPDDKLVLLIQRSLKSLGFHPGPADGIMGPHTRSAIETYQARLGLPEDGKATRELLKRLAQQAGVQTRSTVSGASPRAAGDGLPDLGPVTASARLSGQAGIYALEDLNFELGDKKRGTIAVLGTVGTLAVGRVRPVDDLRLQVTVELPSSNTFARHLPSGTPELRNIRGSFQAAGSADAMTVSQFRFEAMGPGGLVADATGDIAGLSLLPTLAAAKVDLRLGLKAKDSEGLAQLVGMRLPELGSVRARAELHNRADRLILTNIDGLIGSNSRPALRLTGEIGDLLALEQIALRGSFEIPLATLLAPNEGTDTPSLGELQGQFHASDADGSISLESLSAKAIGTDLYSLAAEGAFDDLKRRNEFKLKTVLKVPKPSLLGQRLGFKVGAMGPFSYTGEISGSLEQFGAEGTVRVGRTAFSGILSGHIAEARPVLSAKLTSPVFHFADFGLLPKSKPEQVDQSIKAEAPHLFSKEPLPFEALRGFDLDLDLTLNRLEGVELDIDQAEAQLQLKQGRLKIDPLRFSFVGGSVLARVQSDTHAAQPALGLRLEADNVLLGDLLAQLAVDVPLDGKLDMVLDLSATGPSPRALSSSLKGNWDMALSRGHVQTKLLDLSAVNMVDWMTSDTRLKGYSDLNCFILRLDFQQGIGTIKAALLDTSNVLAPGTGNIDLRAETIDIQVHPRAKKRRLIESTTPFTITGPLTSPSIQTDGFKARMVSEVLLAPLHLLGSVLWHFVHDQGSDPQNPCLAIQPGDAPN